jgi:hypothetical protein
MNNIYETYSHTHRSFVFDETISNYEEKISSIISDHAWLDCLTISDKNLISLLHDQTIIPSVDSCRLPNIPYTPRKNSQMMAPLLILLNPNKKTRAPLNLLQYHVGNLYSRIALKFLSDGYQSGFCICYNHIDVEILLQEWEILSPDKSLFNNIPFLCIGHKEPNFPYNYQKDQNRIISSERKISSREYIKIE